MKNLKEYLVPTITLFIICLVATALLGITNEVTAPIISELSVEQEKESRQEVFPDAVNFKETDNASVVAALDENGSIIGYVVVNAASGYGGDVTVMTGVTTDGKVTGINILSHSETPGLGAKAKTDDGWREQFKGLIKDITVSKDKAGDNSIDAITGATITSRAVVEAVNEAIKLAGGENIG